jgi:hypothetical protein
MVPCIPACARTSAAGPLVSAFVGMARPMVVIGPAMYGVGLWIVYRAGKR